MRLTEVNYEEANAGYKKTKLYAILCEFRDSKMKCARIDDTEYVSAGSGASAFKKSIKRFGFAGIECFTRKGCIYLVKTEEKQIKGD